jgi:hypothetical protein
VTVSGNAPTTGLTPARDGVVGEVGGPAVGGGNGGVELGVAVREPDVAGVVELGECAVLEVDGAVGVARHDAQIGATVPKAFG